MMNVVVPFIYQHMQIEFNYIRAEKDNSHYLEGYDSYYFNMHGVPVIYSTKKEMPGLDWVKDSDYKRISIAQKDGKQGPMVKPKWRCSHVPETCLHSPVRNGVIARRKEQEYYLGNTRR